MRFLVLIILFQLSALAKSTTEELMGPDKNKDGVRDDIGEWIDTLKEYPKNYRLALKQYARFLRDSFKYWENKEESRKNSFMEAYSLNCIELQINKVRDLLSIDVGYYGKKKNELQNEMDIIYRKLEKKKNEKLAKKFQRLSKEKRALKEKYEPIEKKWWSYSKISNKHTSEISERVYNNLEKNKISRQIDTNFSGSTVWSTRDEKKVCFFLNKEENKIK